MARLTVVAIAAGALFLAAPFILMTASIIGDEIRANHGRQAIRAVLRGDCVSAVSESSKAGSVSYDVYRICLTEAR